MTLNRTQYTAYLKERWEKPDAMMQAIIANCPTLGLMRKDPSAGGRYTHVPILRTGPQGRSADYADAKANAVGSQTDGFDVTYGSNYQVAKLTGNVVDDSKGSENALYDAIDNEMKGSLANMKKDIRLQLFGNFGGSRGVVGDYTATELTFILADIEDAVHFDEGMVLESSATDGTSGSVRTGSQAISAINRQTGTITGAAAWDTAITNFAEDDFLFADGDFGSKWSGILGWLPATAPGATLFFGVDRSIDTLRLGGIRYEAQGEPIESAFTNACAQAMLYDAVSSVGIVNPVKWAELSNSLGADRLNRITEIRDTTGVIGYKAIMLATPMGDIPVVSDAGCQNKYGLLLDMDTWCCKTVGEMIHIIDDDGLKIRRGDVDDWLIEMKSRGNFTCNAPGKNVRMAFE